MVLKNVSRILKKGSVFVPDKTYIKYQYKKYIGKELNIVHPVTYNEKLQIMKLYDHNPLYPKLVDKYQVRKYVKNRIGEDYLVDLYGCWNHFEDIPFDQLPNSFVMKCTHDSGGIVLCPDKSKLDIEAAKKKIKRCLRKNYFYDYREWAYKNVPHKIIAEQYIGDLGKTPDDYKFFCFNGEPKFLYIAKDRFVDTSINFYSLDFHKLEVQQDYKNNNVIQSPPQNYEKMIEIARTLSKGLRHVRVDLYNINGKIYFGELTLYSFSGFQKFKPEKFDSIFGRYLDVSDLIAML